MIELSLVLKTMATTAGSRIAERIADRGADAVLDPSDVSRGGRRSGASTLDQHRLVRALEGHLVEVVNWASQLQVWRMSRPASVTDSTIGLRLADMPRKFRSATASFDAAEVVDELELLESGHHYMLLGDPGAGKTTTVKRLINKLLTAPSSSGDDWSVPLLVVLREHSTMTSVANIVLEKLALRGYYLRSLSEGSASANRGPSDLPDIGMESELSEYRFLAGALNSCRGVLFLDGLDEVNPEVRYALQHSIMLLARYLTSAKIIVSCRSGDYRRPMEGFAHAELLPLSEDQIESIAERWLADRHVRFMEEINEGPAGELANRPLFLFQMLVLAQSMEAIPDQPSSLCRQLVRLMLQDWDQQRGIVRTSQYSAFGVDAKLQFLTALAYFCTFQLRTRRVEHRELVQAYENLYRRFGLPPGEAEEVAREIENHTGVIVEAGYDAFEFSHLSIQEYLAAEYVVRLPTSDEHRRLLERSPATVAVAVALSSEPDIFLESLAAVLPPSDILFSFVTRVLQERPRFVGGGHLGSAVLKIMSAFAIQDHVAIYELVRYPEVGRSIQRFVDWSSFRRPRGNWNSVRVPLSPRMCSSWSLPVDSILVSRELEEVLSHPA